MKLRLKLFGHPEITIDGVAIGPLPKKGFAIAARLILSAPDGPVSRDEIAAFLWPEAADEQRRANLRTVIKRIRAALRVCDGAPFRIDDETIAFDTESVTCDLLEFRLRVARGSLADVVEATRLYDGDLLQDCEAGPETFSYWLQQERQRLGKNFARAASNALKGGQLLGQPRLREAIELKILAARPIDASIHRAVTMLHGKRSASKSPRATPPFAIAGWPFASQGPEAPSADDGSLSA